VLLLEDTSKHLEQRKPELERSFTVNDFLGWGTLRCMLFGVLEVLGVSYELVTKRHHKNGILVGASKKFHVVFEQGL
jgi:hypothetical protein